MKSGIYKITNIVNGKFYIGSSEDVDNRWKIEHVGNLRRNQHCNPKLQHSWNFHGGDKFSVEILEEVEPRKELLLEREQYYLDTLKPYDRNIGYNICPTAYGGDNITHNPNRNAFIEKMKLINSGENNGMYGKNHSETSIKLQKDKSIGRYTLDWFVKTHGTNEGLKKFKERNGKLRNRKLNYSCDNKCKGVKRGPMSEEIKKRISERKEHLKLIRQDLHNDILSENFTLMQLQLKYGTSKPTILRERRKLMNRV
jgi:group I intron endonuclease